jgi:hypothetical protein
MSFTLDPERQYPLVAIVVIDAATDLTEGEIEIIKLPVGAVVTKLVAYVDEGFESDSVGGSIDYTASIDIGDDDSNTQYVSDQSVTSVGRLSLASGALGKKYASGGTITAFYHDTDTLDEQFYGGQITVCVEYVVQERINEVQG